MMCAMIQATFLALALAGPHPQDPTGTKPDDPKADPKKKDNIPFPGLPIKPDAKGKNPQIDPSKPLESDLVERSSNILAVYSPSHSSLFATRTTPVNILPRVLNAYLGTTIPEQSDATFAWRGSRLDTIAVDPLNPGLAR